MWRSERFGSTVIVKEDGKEFSLKVQIYSHVRIHDLDEKLKREMEIGEEIAQKLNKVEEFLLDKTEDKG